MLTSRGRVIFALGFGVYVAAWAFGSKPLYPVATGLLLVIGVAWVWVRLSDRPFRVKRGWGDREQIEGDNVPIVAELYPTGNVLPASVTLSARIGRPQTERAATEGALRPRGGSARPLCLRGRARRADGPVRARAGDRAAALTGRAARISAPGAPRSALHRVRNALT